MLALLIVRRNERRTENEYGRLPRFEFRIPRRSLRWPLLLDALPGTSLLNPLERGLAAAVVICGQAFFHFMTYRFLCGYFH